MADFKGNERTEKAWKELVRCDRKEPCESCNRVVNRKAMDAELLKGNIRTKKVEKVKE